MSRLDYAPKLKEVKVTDIKKGLGVFTPLPDKPVGFAALKATLKKAGYTLAAADITVAGTLEREGKTVFLIAERSQQRFELEGSDLVQKLAGLDAGSSVEITGGWTTTGVGLHSREIVNPRQVKRTVVAKTAETPLVRVPRSSHAAFSRTKFIASEFLRRTSSSEVVEFPKTALKPAAPIRVTSPGLTVYKGGAVTPRLYFINQHLGDLNLARQTFDLSISYTPSPRVQLEIEVPISRTTFQDNLNSGSGVGLGNITLWSKYRFFRKVKTYGDRQASARFGLELPTGKKDASGAAQINAPAFVRQQLTPISGGLSPHFDVAFSQAGGRFIFGGNAEAILRSERAGFRMGHELRVSTDTEYVLLPRKYVAPGGELFVILETTFVHRKIGRLASASVPGSNSTEYYLAPGLQYAAAPQFVIEGSIQFPVIRNAGPLVLRNDRSLLFGVRYLF
ncbi:MAG: hypothetical protein ABR501_09700 [Pyrinomonadaceae bacterium]